MMQHGLLLVPPSQVWVVPTIFQHWRLLKFLTWDVHLDISMESDKQDLNPRTCRIVPNMRTHKQMDVPSGWTRSAACDASMWCAFAAYPGSVCQLLPHLYGLRWWCHCILTSYLSFVPMNKRTGGMVRSRDFCLCQLQKVLYAYIREC